MWIVYVCIGYSFGLATAAIVWWLKVGDPTRWAREDEYHLMSEEYETIIEDLRSEIRTSRDGD